MKNKKLIEQKKKIMKRIQYETEQNNTEKSRNIEMNKLNLKNTWPLKETGMEINERAQTSARLNDTVDVIEIYLNKRKNYFNLKPLLLLDYYYINI